MTALRFAVIGDPVSHSKSPAMQGAALKALGLPHTYEAIRTTADELPGVVQALREGRFAGLNVTVPHKTAVLALVDDMDASARFTGAANTLVREPDGRVVAYNTDAPALASVISVLLEDDGPAALEKRGLVLGSGGAARAAVAAFHLLGMKDVVVRSRKPGPVFELSKGFPAWQPWAADAASEALTSVVVQATSAGMTGTDPGEAVADVVAWNALTQSAVAIDVVYAPVSTPFLQAAGRRGLRGGGGLGMLAVQGGLALELWLEVSAPLDVMLAAIGAGA
jgi:shikimate dehydrogenase